MSDYNALVALLADMKISVTTNAANEPVVSAAIQYDIRVNNPAPYTGAKHSIVSADNFISILEKIFILQPQSTGANDVSKITYASHLLTGAAFDWLRALESDPHCPALATWSLFKSAFLTQWGDPERARHAARRLRQLRLGPTQSISDYVTYFKKTLLEAEIPLSTPGNHNWFVTGLQHDSRGRKIEDKLFELFRVVPSDLDSYLNEAIRWGDYFATRTPLAPFSLPAPSAPSPAPAPAPVPVLPSSLPPAPFPDDPMHLGAVSAPRGPISSATRAHRTTHSLCIYCGEHAKTTPCARLKAKEAFALRNKSVSSYFFSPMISPILPLLPYAPSRSVLPDFHPQLRTTLRFSSSPTAYSCLLDTGAPCSILDSAYVLMLGFRPATINKFQLSSVSGHPLHITAKLILPIILQGKSYIVPFFVMDSPTEPIIIGMNVLSKNLSHHLGPVASLTLPAARTIPSKYQDFTSVFDPDAATYLPRYSAFNHDIDLEAHAKPFWGPIYPLSADESRELQDYITTNLKTGFIRESKSPYLFAKKLVYYLPCF